MKAMYEVKACGRWSSCVKLVTFVVGFVCITLAPYTNGQEKPTFSTTAKNVAQTARENLGKLPDESKDQQLPAAVRGPVKQYRDILKRSASAEELSEDQLRQLEKISKDNLNTIRNAVQKEDTIQAATQRQELTGCLRGCQTHYDRCTGRLEPGDWVGGYICSLDATGCTVVCTMEAFSAGADKTK